MYGELMPRKAWIINNMPNPVREVKMTLRLTEDEARLRDALADHLGIDASGVLRMALLKLARIEGVVAPQPEKEPRRGNSKSKP